MKLIEIESGDVLVVRCDEEISVETAVNFREHMLKIIPDGSTVIILTPGIDIDVIKKSVNP